MKKIFMFTLILSLILCSFLATVEKSKETTYSFSTSSSMQQPGSLDQTLPYSQYTWLNQSDDMIPEVICRTRIISSELLTRAVSYIGWLGILFQLIHIILFACIALAAGRICYTNTSRRFIIRYIHSKDGHKRLAFAF